MQRRNLIFEGLKVYDEEEMKAQIIMATIGVTICDPFWHNESEVAESRTEIWASEVGIGSKNGKRLFSIFSILDISRFISQNVKPQPPPPVPQTEL